MPYYFILKAFSLLQLKVVLLGYLECCDTQDSFRKTIYTSKPVVNGECREIRSLFPYFTYTQFRCISDYTFQDEVNGL
jgi:hypothetical protein